MSPVSLINKVIAIMRQALQSIDSLPKVDPELGYVAGTSKPASYELLNTKLVNKGRAEVLRELLMFLDYGDLENLEMYVRELVNTNEGMAKNPFREGV